MMTLQHAVDLIHSVARRGPTPAMYANIHQAFIVLAGAPIEPAHVEELLVKPSYQRGGLNLIEAIFRQPFGYAGDFELLSRFYAAYDALYDGYIEGRSSHFNVMATRWDEYVLSLPAVQALYNREKYLLKRVDEIVAMNPCTSILDIACGNGRFLRKVMNKYPSMRCCGIDAEPKAIYEASSKHWSHTPELLCMNALTHLPQGRWTTVISSGLFDYLTFPHAVRLLRRIKHQIDPRTVIIGNMQWHEHEAEMLLLGWDLIYRSRVHLTQIGGQFFSRDVMHVDDEYQGVNLFLNIERS